MKVFIAYSSGDRELVTALMDVLKKQKHEVLYPSFGDSIENSLSPISTLVHSADVVVALLSGQNANVYYELGIATGAGKQILVVAPSSEDLASDLCTIPYIQSSDSPLQDAQAVVRRLSDFPIVEQEKKQMTGSAIDVLKVAWDDPAYLDAMTPSEFEKLIGVWLTERGYTVRATTETGDTGYDFSIDCAKQGRVILVEAKKVSRQSRVSVEAVKQLMSAMHMAGAVSGLVVSTSGYTSAAAAFGATNSIALRTIEDLYKTKTEEDLLAPGIFNELTVIRNVRLYEDVIKPALYNLSDRMGASTVRIDTNSFKQLPPITIDTTAIRSVVLELLSNAIKYSPSGSTISLNARIVSDAVEITFSNPSGKEVRLEDAERLFEMGYRGIDGFSTQRLGLGMGLAIARNLVRAHYGAISAHVQDETFTVTVRLPLNIEKLSTV